MTDGFFYGFVGEILCLYGRDNDDDTDDNHGCYISQILMSVKEEVTTVTPTLHVPTPLVLTTVHVMMDISEMDKPVVNIWDETSGLQHINRCKA